MMTLSHPGLTPKSYALTSASPGKTALGRPPPIVASLTNTSALVHPTHHTLSDSLIDAAEYLETQNERSVNLSVKKRESLSLCLAFDHDDMILKRG
jgi:hypothetical protein